jgi:hypothetical protein
MSLASRRSANNCDPRTDDTPMEPQDAPRQENREIFPPPENLLTLFSYLIGGSL